MTDMGLGCAKTRWKRLDASRFGLTASRRFGRGGFSLPSRAPEEVPARPPRLHWRREPLGRSSGGHSGHGNYGPRQCSLMAGFHRLRPHCALFHQLLHVDAVGRHRLAGFRHRHADLVVGGLQAHRGRRRDRAHRLRPLLRAAVHQHDRGRGRRNHLGRACLRSRGVRNLGNQTIGELSAGSLLTVFATLPRFAKTGRVRSACSRRGRATAPCAGAPPGLSLGLVGLMHRAQPLGYSDSRRFN